MAEWDELKGVPDARRFAVELEFVQCLASPHYVNCKQAGVLISVLGACG